MKFKNKFGYGMLMVFLAGMGAERIEAANNVLTPAEKKAGWILLFDGIDKDAHWRHGETGAVPSKWTVEDSAMRTVNAYTFLCTKAADQFTDFEWQVDWKLAKGGNSGLFSRVHTDTYNDGYEYAILDDEYGGDRMEVSKNPADKLPNGKMPYIKRTGSVYDLYPTTKNGAIGGQYYDSTVTLPFGQWNRGVVWANGTFLEHWLNGKKVVDAEIGSADWDARFNNSKWHTNETLIKTWAKHATGSLCFQAHGGGDAGLAWFRNIKVRPFISGDTLVSPSISPNGGSFSSSMKVGMEVAITGAIIRYTLDGTEPSATSQIYTDSITLSATSTLKAKTFRARFKNSSTTSVTFNRSGSFIQREDLSPFPYLAISSLSRRVRLVNKNGSDLRVEVVDLKGLVYSTLSIRQDVLEYVVNDLQPGVYLVKLSRGSWTQTRKLTLH